MIWPLIQKTERPRNRTKFRKNDLPHFIAFGRRTNQSQCRLDRNQSNIHQKSWNAFDFNGEEWYGDLNKICPQNSKTEYITYTTRAIDCNFNSLLIESRTVHTSWMFTIPWKGRVTTEIQEENKPKYGKNKTKQDFHLKQSPAGRCFVEGKHAGLINGSPAFVPAQRAVYDYTARAEFMCV